MNKKHLFATLGLAVVLGAGVATGINFDAKSAKAEGETAKVYLELDANIWGEADAYYTIHYWGGTEGSSWPGASFNVEPAKGNTVLSTEWDPASTHCIIVRYGDAEHTNEWNRWDWFDKNGTMEPGQYNYFKVTDWSSCDSSYVYETTLHVGDETISGFAKKGEEYVPSAVIEGSFIEGWYLDSKFETPYVPAEPTGNIELYAKEGSFENTGVIYAQSYDWDSHYLHVWEEIDGHNYNLLGSWCSEEESMNAMYNVNFVGDGVFRKTFKYNNAANVKFVYTDGKGNQSADTAFNPGTDGKGCYVKFSGVENELSCDPDFGEAASFIYDIVSKMTVEDYDTSYGERDYSICAFTEEQKTAIVNGYTAVKGNAIVKSAIDSSLLYTYAAGELNDYSEYGMVSFVDILNQIAGYDIVGLDAAPANYSLPANNSVSGLIGVIALIVAASGFTAFLLKRKFAK